MKRRFDNPLTADRVLQPRPVDHIVASIPDDGRVAVKHGDFNAWNVIVSEDGLSG